MHELIIKKKHHKWWLKRHPQDSVHLRDSPSKFISSGLFFFFLSLADSVKVLIKKSVEYADKWIIFKTLSYIIHSNYVLFNMTLHSAMLHFFIKHLKMRPDSRLFSVSQSRVNEPVQNDSIKYD